MPVTPTASNVRRLSKTSFRWRFPDRALHVVDIENLAGAAVPTLARVTEIQSQYLASLRFGVDDQVVLASSHLGLLSAGLGWPHARHLVRSGKDGADLELIDVLEHENIAARFRHVVIGSGDGGFSRAAAELMTRGIHVTVVSRWGSLAYELAKAADDVIYLDGPLTAAA
jgi:NYN domain